MITELSSCIMSCGVGPGQCIIFNCDALNELDSPCAFRFVDTNTVKFHKI